jgi:hypothetical protein
MVYTEPLSFRASSSFSVIKFRKIPKKVKSVLGKREVSVLKSKRKRNKFFGRKYNKYQSQVSTLVGYDAV